ncbi:WAT1-related protein At5g64700-like isoform X2 [Carya illinoinensis]|uniref:WAT1-related protein At5g64700-like isoform X2 n=1 Tax=Carya illinoinensis TaxID=32201 RepID=UPI001C7215F7|nr:WAT1-related protein At5g64700-like isoform X2 [Carya illinoinensis]
MGMNMMKNWFEWSKVVVSMIMVQLFAAGLQLLSRVILSQGTFVFAYMAYRHAVAAICVAPFAFYFERGNAKNLRWSVWFWLFLSALTGISMAMGLYSYGLRDTTATYATNFLNLIPITTFVFSIIAGIEKMGLNTRAGKLKTMGAIVCLAGALTASLYRGQAFHLNHHSLHPHLVVKPSKAHWARGTFLLVASCFSYGAWFIVQGALTTAATFCIIAWVISLRGPTYPAMFNPLSLIFVALSEAIILGEEIRLGTILGMILIIFGLYSFLWGKGNEIKSAVQANPSIPAVNSS